jgi:hypothetical protein
MNVLILLALFALYIVITVLVTRAVTRRMGTGKSKWISGVLTVGVFVLIPTWDEILGTAYFLFLCSKEGGQKIYRTVEITKNYYTPNVADAALPNGEEMEVGRVYLVRIKGTEYKVRLVPDRKKLSDRYDIAVAQWAPSKKLGVQKISSHVKDKKTNEFLGTATSFAYWGGSLANRIGHVTAKECPTEPADLDYVHSPFLEKIFIKD